jgi:alpha-beta hydrolase superfamily lysophospholipase
MAVPTFPGPAEARHEEGFLSSKGGVRIHWQRFTPREARATVAVLPGGGDHGGRYPALTAALVRAGLAAALVDVRGHGLADGRRWHVDLFDDYLADVDAFMAHVRAGAAGGKVFVVGHSQGGLVAALWGMRPGNAAAGFVLSSPYFKLKLDPPRVKVLAATLVGKVVPWLPVSTDLHVEDLTSDEEMQRWTDADPLYGRRTTPRWFAESRRVQADILRRAPSFTHPLLVLAGGDDRIADAAAMRAFHDGAGSTDKAWKEYPGFRHELFNERERERPVGDAVAWIAARAG